MAEPGRWPLGEDEIETLIERGEFEEIEPSGEHAKLLMEQAEGHLDAAAPLLETHPPSAFTRGVGGSEVVAVAAEDLDPLASRVLDRFGDEVVDVPVPAARHAAVPRGGPGLLFHQHVVVTVSPWAP